MPSAFVEMIGSSSRNEAVHSIKTKVLFSKGRRNVKEPVPESMPPGGPNELAASGERQVDALGRYKILGELGRGGCGVVYRALDPSIGRIVAIKTILTRLETSSDGDSRERFRREARSAGKLSHPNIVTVYDFSDTGDPMFIAMEYIEGRTLAEFLSNNPIELRFALRVLRSAADALDYAHSHQIVHRDVKPANFLIVEETGRVKMTDFGIAKILGIQETLTDTGMLVGTAHYMSPEQISGAPITGRSDQFSLAVIAYQMLSGIRPFQGDTLASLIHAIIMANPPDINQYNKELNMAVGEVLRKALAKTPESRYNTCLEFCDALDQAVLGAAIEPVAMPPQSDLASQIIPSLQSERSRRPEQVDEPTKTTPLGLKVTDDLASASRPRFLNFILAGVFGGAVAATGWWLGLRSRVEKPGALRMLATETVSHPALPAPSPFGAAKSPAKVVAPSIDINERKSSSPTAGAQRPSRTAAPPPEVTSSRPNPPSRPQNAPPIISVPSPVTGTPNNQQAPSIQPAPSPTPTPIQPPPGPPPAVASAPPPASRPGTDAYQERAAEQRAKRLADEQAQLQHVQQAKKEADDQARHIAEEQAKAAIASRVESISKALVQYQSAYQRKDLNALRTIWPSIPKQLLDEIHSSFRAASEVRMNLQPTGDPEVSGTTATVVCVRSLHQVIMKQALDASGKVRIVLRQLATGWIIQSVDPIQQ